MTLLSLCDLDDVKRRLSITDTSSDAELGDLIVAVSAAIERHCNRAFYTESRTEVYDVVHPAAGIALRAYPVASITSVKNNADWDWANTTAVDAADYLTTDGGLLHVQGSLACGPRALQVVYEGGIGTSVAAVQAVHPDIVIAAEMQVAEEWMRKDSQGPVTYSLSEGGGMGQREALKLLPAVVQRLSPHRRRVL